MRILKRIIIVSASISLLFSNISYGADWEKKGNDWYYHDEIYPKGDRWVKDFGYWYYIDQNNKMVTGKLDDKYYLNDKEDSDIPYGALIEEDQILLKDKETQDKSVSYYEVKRKNLTDYNKVVIILHGLCGIKDEYRYYGSVAADDGYLAIVPELYGHEKDQEGSIADIIKNTSYNIDKILDEYGVDKEIKIDIMGCSLGGLIGSYYCIHGKHKVNKASLLISTLDYESLTNDIFLYKYKNGKATNRIGLSAFREEIQDIKIKDSDNFRGAEIKVYNTETDPYIPYNNSAVKIARHGKSNIKHIKLNYKGHKVTVKELLESMLWIIE